MDYKENQELLITYAHEQKCTEACVNHINDLKIKLHPILH